MSFPNASIGHYRRTIREYREYRAAKKKQRLNFELRTPKQPRVSSTVRIPRRRGHGHPEERRHGGKFCRRVKITVTYESSRKRN